MSLRSKLFGPMVWGNLLAMVLVIILAIIGAWFFLTEYTLHGEAVKVPHVEGMQLDDARYQLERLGLKAVVMDSVYEKHYPAQRIMEQHPAQGREVKSGREIYLVVNTGRSPMVTLPDIANNCSLREAQAKLTAMGFKLGPVEYVEGKDKDWVRAIKYNGRIVYAGERLPLDAPLVLQVEGGSYDLDIVDDDTLDSEGGLDILGDAPNDIEL